MFFWNSLAFSMIQRMLAIWSLVPLPFLKPAWTSGINAAATLENCLAVSSKVKHTLTLRLSDFPPRFLSKRNLCTSPQEKLMQTFIAAVVKIPPNRKQFKYHRLMNAETNCATFMVWSVKSYKKKKTKGILPIYRTSWLNLKSICKVREARLKKPKYYINPLYAFLEKRKLRYKETGLGFPGGGHRRRWSAMKFIGKFLIWLKYFISWLLWWYLTEYIVKS